MTNTERKKIVDSAFWYGKHHRAVFPVDGKKHPLTEHGCKDASTDPEVIRSMFNENCNFEGVAIATGPASGGMFAIDLDRHEDGTDGVETARTWQQEHGEFNRSWVACTPSGGQHLFFLGTGKEKCSVNSDFGIDCRGAGGYVVAAPSMNGSYFWDISPAEAPLAEPNKSLLDFMEVYCKSADKKQHFHLPTEIPEGCRNSTLFSAACSMQATGFPDESIEAAIRELNRLCCRPAVSSREVTTILNSALKNEKGGALTRWETKAELQEREVLQKLDRQLKSYGK